MSRGPDVGGQPPVAILGLGLIGGSLARDLARSGVPVLGWDRDDSAIRRALGEGVLADALGPELAGIERAHTVVIAVPVDAAALLLNRIAPAVSPAALVTDVGSTKRSIMTAAAAAGLGDRFIGSHPLAGDHRSGWDASREGLFAGKRVFLTVDPAAGNHRQALERTEALWRSVGGEPEVTDAATHDRRMAWVSHLPQLAASAVGLALGAAGFSAGDLGSGGRDVTRLVASSPEIWAAIAADNRDEIEVALRTLSTCLAQLAAGVAAGDRDRLRELFAAAAYVQPGGIPDLAAYRPSGMPRSVGMFYGDLV